MNSTSHQPHLPDNVLIVGGGIIGLAIAYELARFDIPVRLIERGQLGQEASYAAAGMLGADVEANIAGPFWELCRTSQDLYPEWLGQLEQFTNVHCGYRDSGIVRIARDEEDEHFLRDKALWLQPTGGWQDPEQLRSIIPTLGSDIRGGIMIARDHQVDPRKLVVALRMALQLLQVEVLEGCEVVELLRHDQSIRGVRMRDGRTVEAAHVVIAGGAWSIDLLRPLGYEIPIYPVHGQCYSLRPKRELTSRIIYTKGCYLVPREDGTLVVGATQEDIGYVKKCTVEAIQELHAKAVQLLPELKRSEWLHTWSGLRPGTADGLPLLGPLADFQQLSIASGHFRNGILLTPITAQLIRQWLMGESASIDWKPFFPDRFDRMMHLSSS